jgi:hypothetical protein
MSHLIPSFRVSQTRVRPDRVQSVPEARRDVHDSVAAGRLTIVAVAANPVIPSADETAGFGSAEPVGTHALVAAPRRS